MQSSQCTIGRSARLRFGSGELISALPSSLHVPGRSHLGLECAVARKPLELSTATGELILAFDGDRSAIRRDLALERTPVTTVGPMIVDEVAALAARTARDVRDTPVGD